jgi:ABC-type nickel/cobalt efflux system permease component RcnA
MIVLAGLAALPVHAHQLTGTDVATLARFEVDHNRLAGVYEVYLGELAALEERRQMDQDGDGRLSAGEQAAYLENKAAALRSGLALSLDGQPLTLRLAGGEMLPPDSLVVPAQLTLRFRLDTGPVEVVQERALHFRDANALPRQVHADIAIEALPLVDLGQVDPGEGALKQMRVQAPAAPVEARVLLQPSTALWRFPDPAGSAASPGAASSETPSSTDELAALLRSGQLSVGLMAFALLLAFLLGAVHALEPGHGKTIVAAYLIGSRGTVGNAVYLGAVVTFTHTFSVLLLGLITLFASQYILPEELFPWLSAGSGLLIWGLGLWLFVRALTGKGHGHSHGPHGHHHGPAHDHPHPHLPETGHLLRPLPAHRPGSFKGYEFSASPPASPPQASRGSLLTLGISGGIVPCPGALVILLLAVALHRITFGLLLILAFSLGLAAVLIAIGVLMVKARPLLDRFSGEDRLARRLPLISSVVIMAVGLVMAVRALMEAGILIIRRPAS